LPSDTVRWPPGQRLQADSFQLPGDGVVDLPGRAYFRRGDLFQNLQDGIAPEGSASGEQFVEHRAEAEDVRAAVHAVALAAGLLRAHVRRRPGESAALAEILLPEREAEIDHIGLACGVKEDIGRFDVAVDEMVTVGVVQRLGHRGHQRHRLGYQGPPLLQPDGKVLPLNELGDNVAEPVVSAAYVVDGDDVGVIEPGEDAGLCQVGVHVRWAGDPHAVRHLDGHVPPQFLVMAPVDNAKAAGPQPARDSITAQAGWRFFLGGCGFGMRLDGRVRSAFRFEQDASCLGTVCQLRELLEVAFRPDDLSRLAPPFQVNKNQFRQDRPPLGPSNRQEVFKSRTFAAPTPPRSGR
jgi:hypothetical protein